MLLQHLKSRVPNLLTLSRLFLMPLALFFLYRKLDQAAFLLYLFIALTDFWDGYLARKWNVCSPSGIVLDQVSDKLVGLGFFTGLTLLGLCPVWFLLILLLTASLLGFGYAASQFIPKLTGPQVSLRLGKWSTALQYIWIGWLLVMPYHRGLTDFGFYALAVLQVLVLVLYAKRLFRNHRSHPSTHFLAKT